MHPENLKAGKRFGASSRFKVCTGARYLGGYIGNEKSKCEWLKDRTEKWGRNIHAIAKMAVGNYTHQSSTMVISVIQSECIFLKRVTKDTGQAFVGLEKFMQQDVLLVFSLENCKPSLPL